MLYKKALTILFVLVIFYSIYGLFSYLKSMPLPEDSEYVGSSICVDCHILEHADWRESLHSKMMRKVTDPDVIVADMHSKDMIFDSKEAVWAIGSKWEQQFMGENETTEKLLPGAWHVNKDKWKTTGWDGWKKPEPLKRCHGCHTVGLDVNTGKFVEPSIGCESCHGKGSWHSNTAGIGTIASGLDAQICGQCHTRGRSTNGEYFFPVGYEPGDNLADYFIEEEPDYIQNSSKWWGNGHPRKRHQEYYSWRQDGHVNSLSSLKDNYDGKYGKVTGECLSCHAAEAIADEKSKNYELSEVKYGITCVTCHNPHSDSDKPPLECSSCHGEGASYHNSKINDDHIPCPNEANVACVQCHMPLTVMNGGDYTLHSHRAGIIPPGDTQKFGVPNSCANGGCHTDRDIEWLDEEFNKHYKNNKN